MALLAGTSVCVETLANRGQMFSLRAMNELASGKSDVVKFQFLFDFNFIRTFSLVKN